MSYTIKRFVRPLVCITLLVLCNTAEAQEVLLQHMMDKVESCKSLSYINIYKQKEVFSDTLEITRRVVLLKMPDNEKIGYFFRHESKQAGMKVPVIELYNGKNLVSLNSADSTFHPSKNQAVTFRGSLLGSLNWIKMFIKKDPSKIIQSPDTVFNSINSYHLILKIRDTIVNEDHLYVHKHLFISKATGLPAGIINRSRGAIFGKEITDYYNEDDYSDYRINQQDISIASFDTPKWYHLPKEKPKQQTVALLKQGDAAPDWTLYDTDGKKTSLSQMKGKIVLLDFFFVGCGYCLQSLAPLDRLQEKYKDKNFEILSISDRDNQKLSANFKKAQKIKNQIYPEGGNVAKLYHVAAAPTFYLLDQQGKIASVTDGYYDTFESSMTTSIDKLLKK